MGKLLTSVAIFAMIGVAEGKSITGEVLALNHAYRVADDDAIENYLDQALRVSPNDPLFLNQAMLSAVYQQDLEKAVGYLSKARLLNVENQTADLIEIANALSVGDFLNASEFGEKFEFFDDSVMQAWALAKYEDVDAAISHLDRAIEDIAELEAIYKYQKAMIYAHFDQDYSKSDEIIMSEEAPLYLSDQSLYAHMAMKVLNGDEDVEEVLGERYGIRDNWPASLVQIIEAARDGKIDSSVSFASPQNIAAEYFSFVLAQSRNTGIPYQTERLFVTLIPAIAPKNDVYKKDMLAYFYGQDEYDDVIKFSKIFQKNSAYAVDRDAYLFSALMQLDRVEEARDVLENRKIKGIESRHSIADGYRYLEEYDQALVKYEELLNIDGLPPLRRASVVYAAAICAERLGDWTKANGYFREAISLQPDRADILNYLGYSLVDRGEDVDEGLELIEKAIKIDSSQAYIQDSLGWAYFHAGRYAEALTPLELAVSQMGSDPIVNGHLGDVYWKLDRRREARFQWERALKFLEEDLPDMKRADLENRIENGLPD